MIKCCIYNFEDKNLQELNLVNDFESIDEFVLSLPIGVYTTLRTVGKNKIFQLKYHLQRLKESFSLSKSQFPYNIDEIRNPLHLLLDNFFENELRIRIFIPIEQNNICYFIFEDLIVPNPLAYKIGVNVGINKLIRRNPKAKLTSFIQNSKEIKYYCKKHNLEESIIVNEKNELLEGLTSNFFAVMKNKIYTADKEVLSGSVRELVLDEINKAKISIQLTPINYENLEKLSEAFITSTSRGVLPVVRIDNHIVGSGQPGNITKYLSDKLKERLISEAEEIN